MYIYIKYNTYYMYINKVWYLHTYITKASWSLEIIHYLFINIYMSKYM